MRAMSFRLALLFTAIAFAFTGCVSTPPYEYHYIPGRTATLDNGYAQAPPAAPPIVRQAVAAGNELIGKPSSVWWRTSKLLRFRLRLLRRGFVCASFDRQNVHANAIQRIAPLRRKRPWQMDYVSNASQGHSFIVIAGLRFDTGYGTGTHGPKWLTRSRPANDFVMRHPGGL